MASKALQATAHQSAAHPSHAARDGFSGKADEPTSPVPSIAAVPLAATSKCVLSRVGYPYFCDVLFDNQGHRSKSVMHVEYYLRFFTGNRISSRGTVLFVAKSSKETVN